MFHWKTKMANNIENWWLLFVLQVAAIYVHAGDTVAQPSVETKVGTIIGTYKQINVFGQQMTVERYLGIPYAEPPIGDLRFRKPIPRKPFTSPYSAVKFGNTCYQILGILPVEDARLSEDCLVLNIYVPPERTASLAVMIFIHGGGFVAGSADPAVSDTLAAYGDVIIVTINYRLSLWGFLSTGDEYAPGNYGLWDQHMAINWVHDNIEAFGGDSHRVTIFGESAGSISVVFQSLYSGNKGLFQRAIAESGSTTAQILALGSHKQEAEKLGKLVGCEDVESQKLIGCLKSIPVSLLNATLNNFTNGLLGFPMPFVPNVDGEFVKESPKDVLCGESEISSADREFFSTVNLLTGICAEEGVIMIPPLVGVTDLETFEPNRTFYEETFIPKVLSMTLDPTVLDAIKEVVIHEYTDWTDPEDTTKRLHKLSALLADIIFSLTTIETVKQHESLAKNRSATYLYMFDVSPSVHLMPTPSWLTRATHADELIYLFYEESGELIKMLPGRDDYIPMSWEKDVAKNMINMWSNFAKTGNPNKPTPVQMFWPKYTKQDQQYLHITRNMSSDSVKSYFLEREYNLWTKTIPALKKMFDNAETGHCERDKCQP